MPSYAAFLGHQPHLSIAELSAVAPGFKNPQVIGSSVVIFDSTADLTAEDFDMLGGSVALGKELTEGGSTVEEIPHLLRSQFKNVSNKKVTFGLRTFGLQPGSVKKYYHDCKAFLKTYNLPSRYIGSEKNPAAAVLVHDSGILTSPEGCELMIVKTKDKLWIGRTVAVQDIEAYAKRDMKKPVRDTRAGLLPPKLAQMLLNFGLWLVKDKRPNLSDDKDPIKVLDPFCGTGVIPMECLIRGFRVLACDVSEKAISGCTKNMDWIRKEHAIAKKAVPSTIWKHDARKPFDLKGKDLPDVIVTEGSLGPALAKQAAVREAESMRREMDELNEAFLRNVAATLPGVSVIMTWPVWFTSKGPIMLEKTREKLHEIGFQLVTPAGVHAEKAPRGTLLYKRPDQYVGREILILKAKTK